LCTIPVCHVHHASHRSYIAGTPVIYVFAGPSQGPARPLLRAGSPHRVPKVNRSQLTREPAAQRTGSGRPMRGHFSTPVADVGRGLSMARACGGRPRRTHATGPRVRGGRSWSGAPWSTPSLPALGCVQVQRHGRRRSEGPVQNALHRSAYMICPSPGGAESAFGIFVGPPTWLRARVGRPNP
jgi:hypothetical protein